LLKLNKVSEAVNAFERAAQLDPNNSETAAALDSARMNLNGEEESVSRSDNKLSTDESELMNNLFLALM
jgi:cytochrome c-type biogenesis protein CcmH/NrfG